MTHPTDALRLVPVEPTEAMLEAAWEATRAATPEQRMLNLLGDPKACHDLKMKTRWSAMLAAAPASPLPGGGDWINGLPDVPVGSPAWCAWATHEIMNLRAKLPAAPTGDA